MHDHVVGRAREDRVDAAAADPEFDRNYRLRALAGLGFADVADLRVGKVIEVDVEAATPDAARARVDEMCRKLLANPVLEDYAIE